jgi:hypothetical protein
MRYFSLGIKETFFHLQMISNSKYMEEGIYDLCHGNIPPLSWKS